jgi:hypothetical protein
VTFPVAPHRVLAAFEALCAALFGALVLELLLGYGRETVSASRQGIPGAGLYGIFVLGIVLLVPAVLFALGARSLFKRWPRRWAIQSVLALVVGLLVWCAVMLTRAELSTRLVRYDGQLCTEYFDLKDGMPVRAECPSRGGEWYGDTMEVRTYPANFPVKRGK